MVNYGSSLFKFKRMCLYFLHIFVGLNPKETWFCCCFSFFYTALWQISKCIFYMHLDYITSQHLSNFFCWGDIYMTQFKVWVNFCDICVKISWAAGLIYFVVATLLCGTQQNVFSGYIHIFNVKQTILGSTG